MVSQWFSTRPWRLVTPTRLAAAGSQTGPHGQSPTTRSMAQSVASWLHRRWSMADPAELHKVISSRIDQAATKLYRPYTPENNRGHVCSVDRCLAVAYAKGMCNAHYIRSRNGKDMMVPVRVRAHDGECAECKAPINGAGGWGLCDRHYKKKRRDIVRSACIEFLGGRCSRCHREYPDYVYDFHHISPAAKDFSISDSILSRSLVDICAEVCKCLLLCANCHRIEHHG